MADGVNGNWYRITSIITPFLLLVITGFCGYITFKIEKIDDKLFEHLTNAEIHAPTSQIVSKAEFETYKIMNDWKWDDFRFDMNRDLEEIKQCIKEIGDRDDGK